MTSSALIYTTQKVNEIHKKKVNSVPPPLLTSKHAGEPGSQATDVSLKNTRKVLLRILGGGVLPGFPNPDPISDQKM